MSTRNQEVWVGCSFAKIGIRAMAALRPQSLYIRTFLPISRIRRNLQEYDWTLCSGGPGDALGGSGRARGRPLRPADGPDALGAVHAKSLGGGKGLTLVDS